MNRVVVLSTSLGFLFVALAAATTQVNEIDSSVAPDVFDMITSFTNMSYLIVIPAIMIIGVSAVFIGIAYKAKEDLT